MSIGANIKERRIQMKMSQKELSDSVNVTQSMICQIERGSKIPSVYLGKEIADVLGCPLNELLDQPKAG